MLLAANSTEKVATKEPLTEPTIEKKKISMSLKLS